jgi:hypothetical protein
MLIPALRCPSTHRLRLPVPGWACLLGAPWNRGAHAKHEYNDVFATVSCTSIFGHIDLAKLISIAVSTYELNNQFTDDLKHRCDSTPSPSLCVDTWNRCIAH